MTELTTAPSLWPPSFDAAIFDFDGTLADTASLWRSVDEAFLERRGLPYDEEYQRMLSYLGFEAGARHTIERFGLTETPEEICAEWLETSRELYRDSVVLRPGAEAYIRALRERGVSCALATINEPGVLASMRRVNLSELFDACVHGRDVERPKDHPDIYLEAARRLGAPARRCIVFEDIERGLRSAGSAGMQTCAVKTDDPNQDFSRLRALADIALLSWEDLPDPTAARHVPTR